MESIQNLQSGKTFQEPSLPTKEKTLDVSWKNLHALSNQVFQFLDLREKNVSGQKLEQSPETDGPWRGDYSTLVVGVFPSVENVSRLSWTLEDNVPEKYYLSKRACQGILTRALRRGKPLPDLLKDALQEMIHWWEMKDPTLLHNLKQNISIAVFESHSQDARYTKQGNTSPACTAQWGTGGNNMPLVAEKKVFAMQRIGEYKESEQASTMKSRDYKDATDLVIEKNEVKCAGFPLGFRPENTRCYDECATTLCNGTRPGWTTGCILNWIVRRLTPVECERLQGFPDGWTDIGEWFDENGKKHKPADSPRYKALGNSIALPQWYWIFQKMKPYIGENPTLGSLFDGIGGFPLVFESMYGDGTAIWGSEIEPFCVAVTKKHFPED
jgi:DNA (cytosine-5)-methyltransferase 1